MYQIDDNDNDDEDKIVKKSSCNCGSRTSLQECKSLRHLSTTILKYHNTRILPYYNTLNLHLIQYYKV